jgi:acetolactate synthase I/II/III large subunit
MIEQELESMQLTGSEIVIECLKEQGVDTVFGYPGGAILNVYDELYKHQNEIKHILTSHEQGAAHAADGYARATGKVGVCLATSGPGATNLVTGIATAYMDSIPIVAITCNVGVSLLGKDSFQEIDITGITLPITKHNFIVKDVNNLAATIRKAFAIAKKGRPGPVLIDIPKDVTANKAEYVKEKPVAVEPSQNICETQLDTAVEMIKGAKKPYIFVGGGAILSGASEELYTFAKKVDAPVTDSLMGKGAFPGTDPLYTGMLGMHGTKTSNYGVSECDLLIVIGARFSDRVTGNAQKFAQNAKIIQIDVDVAEMNKNVMISAGVVGDIKVVLDRLNERLEQQDHAEWVTKIQEYKEKYPLVYHKDVLSGPFVVEEIYRQTKGEAIISTEVGQHQMWAAQFYKYTKPRTFLTSGGLGTMGYGLGAALGAKSGREDKVVVNIAGDGCFRMNMNEIATAVRHNIPVIQVVINNHVLGMVRQWQNLFYGQRYSATVLNDAVDFVKLAEAMGAEGIRATTQEEFKSAFEKAMNLGRPVVIDCQIDSDDKVWPMVAPGAAISEAFDEADLKNK